MKQPTGAESDGGAEQPSPVPVAGPSITDAEVRAVAHAAETAWYADANTEGERFEQDFAQRVGRDHAIALPSCTSALHLALAALDIGPGDEVIVPDATWIATSAPISYVGAHPVFVDVDPTTWCIDPDAVAAAVTSRTRAVIAVDLYGGLPDWDALATVCERADIALIEDAAEAIGSTYRSRPAGSFGVASTFSFHGSKTLTTGEGGMLVSDDTDLVRRAQVLRDHGRAPGDVTFQNQEVGFKYKMSALQAALGSAQLARLDELVGMKRAIFGWYRERLAGLPVTLNAEPDEVFNSYWMTTIVIDPDVGVTKETLADRLAEHAIATRPFFNPLSALPAYRTLDGAAEARDQNVVSRHLGRFGVNLPSALRLTESDVDRVCAAVAGALATPG